MTDVISGRPLGQGRRIAIAVARFNELVTDRLMAGAVETLVRHGVDRAQIKVVQVPGAFELPLACTWLTKEHDAVLALGAVIRGATSHYDYVCSQAASGVAQAALESGKPVIFGVLTCDTLDQALERAGSKAGNKGAEAAVAALEMADLRDQLGG